jgi:hypothetical protein
MKTKWFVLLSTTIFIVASCKKNDCEEKTKEPNCSCSSVYKPVCGCNGVTYSNSCEADCYGIDEYTAGICK